MSIESKINRRPNFLEGHRSFGETCLLFLFFVFCTLSPFLALFGNFTGFDIFIILLAFIACISPNFVLPRIYVLLIMGLILSSIVALAYTLISYGDNDEAIANFGQILFIATFGILASVYVASKIKLEDFLNSVLITFLIACIILWFSLFIDIPLVKFDTVARYLPTFSGFSSLFIISNAYILYKYKFKLISNLYFFSVLFLSFVACYITQQRSLLAGLLLGLMYLSITEKKSMLLLPILTSIIIYNYHSIYLLLSDLRLINTFLLDNGRIHLMLDFLSTVYESPSILLFGYGIEKWTGLANQEPHNVLLHLISDYGVFGALFYIVLVFGYTFGFLKKSFAINKITVFLILCTLPNFMFHTYSLERGQLMLFLILTAYFVSFRLNLTPTAKITQKNLK